MRAGAVRPRLEADPGGGPTDVHEQRFPGAHATEPHRIPWRGWVQILARALARSGRDRVTLVGAGVAFFGFLALFPTLIAAVAVYGLVADPLDISRHVAMVATVLPADATDLVTDQMYVLVSSDRTRLSLGVAASLLVALWSGSTGVANLVTAVNLAYEEHERSSLVRRRAVALAFTAGAVVTVTLLVALAAVVPLTIDTRGVPRVLIEAARWVALFVVSSVALAAIYRWAPARRDARAGWVTVGAVVATLIWLAASAGFSLYVTFVAGYGRTYGTLAGVVVLLVWMWLTSMAVLLGAEINAEAEHQTDADTTVGPPRPRGMREAVKADTAVGRPDPPQTHDRPPSGRDGGR